MLYTKKERILPFVLAVLMASMLMFTGCNSFTEGFKEGYNGTSEADKNATTSPATDAISNNGFNRSIETMDKILLERIRANADKIISAGINHTVGLKSDGTVIAVGDNYEKQLDVSDWSNIIAVAAGSSHTVGLKSDGTVVAVGNRERGQLDVSVLTDIVAITAGFGHTVGLRADGTVIGVGRDRDGELDVSSWRDIIAISAGYTHTMGLKADGTVVSTGIAALGSDDDSALDLSDWNDIIAIASGWGHAVGLKSDGTVVAEGHNDKGQLNVSQWSNIVAISAGQQHTVGLKSDGTVVATGSNNRNQLNVSDWNNIIAIVAGSEHTVGLKSDGTVVAVGDNLNGQLKVSSWKLQTSTVSRAKGNTTTAQGNSSSTTSKPNGTVTYNISGYDFASSVPDFLAFVTNGAELTNENNFDISGDSTDTVNLTYTYMWSEDDRNKYHDLLKDMGFSLNYFRDGYYEWMSDDVSIDTYFDNPGSIYLCIKNNLHNDGPGDDYNWEEGGSGFNRTDYFTGLSYTDLMRYPDTHAYSKVYFENLEIRQIYEPKLYLVQGILDNKYYIVDDRGSTNPNGLVEDVIAGYGVFHGIETVNWDNGRSDQVPFISADRLIFKRDTPTDYDDFAQGLVAFMNIYKGALTYDNQYLGEAKVRVNASVWNSINGVVVEFIPNPSVEGAATYVDGQLTRIKLSSSKPLTDYGVTIPEYGSKNTVWITGTVVSIKPAGFSGVEITLDVESIVPIE